MAGNNRNNLNHKPNSKEDKDWNEFSLQSAMTDIKEEPDLYSRTQNQYKFPPSKDSGESPIQGVQEQGI